MVFSSATFLFFFLPVIITIYFVATGIGAKNIVLLLFSLLFYAWGEPVLVLLLVGSIAFNALAAIIIDGQVGAPRSWCLAVSVAVNLSLLAVFKYYAFAVDNLDRVLAPLGLHFDVPVIALPLGISFFTFHCLSYLIDVYRYRFPANRRIAEVALYIALFPQLVAGPIVRYKTVAKQLRRRSHRLGRASAGSRIFIIGLAQKVLIADQVARMADVVFDHLINPSAAEAWTGLVAYTVQIYFDFAGYSNMAIGLGLVLGFSLPRNFRLPYAALSMTEFWRRWHMSLSSWLRDYLYIPLGGSRGGAFRTYRNLVTVFLVCGLWHGANWTFALWGLWHGAFLVIERLGLATVMLRWPAGLRWFYTIIAVMFGWVLFRAGSVEEIATLFSGLFGRFGLADIRYSLHLELMPGNLLLLFSGCLLAVLPRWVKLRFFAQNRVFALTGDFLLIGLLAISTSYVAAGTYSPFLYFRF